jgi:hypothetical protein
MLAATPPVIFPNPVSPSVTISLFSTSVHFADLISPSAVIRSFRSLRNPSNTIPVEDLPAALYFLRLTDATAAYEHIQAVL